MAVSPTTESKSLDSMVPGKAIDSTPRPALWADVPDEQWNDWRWQMSHRLNSVEELSQIIELTPEEIEGLQAENKFRVDITPYFASLLEDDPYGPVRLQVIPKGKELVGFESMMADSLAEDAHSPVPGLVHRYPDRVLMLVTTQCASYCRYCTRSRVVGDPTANYSRSDHDAQIEYIKNTPQVRDVLLSGGDPLTLADSVLERLLSGLRAIPHVEIIRIGTRVPFFVPQRVTEELVTMLKRYHPLWMNIHFNHPAEITKEVEVALGRLADAGIPLGSQSVLLAGVNDCPNVIKALGQKLVRNRVRPYYLYQCDLVEGAGHFRTPVAKGIEIMESLRGHTSGFAIPQYVIDAPGGGGKIPILPNYLISQSDTHVVVRNYEGMISSYAQPDHYQGHDISRCQYCNGREGVSALLDGRRHTIKPEGWERKHVKHSE